MKRLVLACALTLFAIRASAGEAIYAFEPGKPPPPEALKNVPVKAVVAEFLDPDNTHLGKEIGYLIWREVLTAVSDQRGAGVILAHPPGNQRLVDLLQQSYHQAALKIAESQNARMALWGALSEDNGSVVIDSYLSLVGEATRDELAIKLKTGFGPPYRDTGLSATISRTRFNFPRVRITRQALFERPLRVQNDTDVYADPKSGRVLARVHVNDILQADGMEGEWFRIVLSEGNHGYVRSANVYVPPHQVETLDSTVLSSAALGALPAPGDPVLPSHGSYEVVGSRYDRSQGLWYQVKSQDRTGWVSASKVRARFSLPVVHFAAGIYRYQFGRYELAVQEFETFTGVPSATQDAPSLSTAYQLIGASQMMGQLDRFGSATNGFGRNTWEAFGQAVQTTPYDPSPHTLRALAMLGRSGRVADALPDLSEALELDPEQPDASNTLSLLLGFSRGRPNPLAGRFHMGPNDVRRIEELTDKYNIAPK